MNLPRWRSDYLVVRVPDPAGDALLVLGETRRLLVEDAAAVDLADLLDGHHGPADLMAALAPRHPAAAVARALRRLSTLELLAEGPVGAVDQGVAAAWDARGVSPDRAQAEFKGRVLAIDAGAPAMPSVMAALRQAGFAVSIVDIGAPRLAAALDADPEAHLVVAPRQLTTPALAELNRLCLAARRPYTLIRPHGLVLLLGPHVVPGVTGCWACLRARWEPNEQVENFLAGRDPSRPRVEAAIAVLEPAAAALGSLLAAELPVLALRGRSPRLTGRMIALDTRDFTTSDHVLVKLPQCPACGEPELLSKAPTRVDLAAGERFQDGGSRTRTTAQTYQLVAPEVSRYLGVVSRLEPLGGPDTNLMFSFRAGHHFPVGPPVRSLRDNLRGHSGGTGRTEVQARVSSIAEAVERYCGVWRDDRPTQQARAGQLDPRLSVALSELLQYSDRQYAGRSETNATASHFNHVPRPSTSDTMMAWTTGWSVTRGLEVAVPAAYCWYGHPDQAVLGVCAADSNGSAAGNTLAEAIVRGFCELVERDSVALWWYHRSRVPGVDLGSFADPWIDAVRAHHGGLGRHLWALDLSADLGIPAFAALSARADGREVLVGFGADLQPADALNRAIGEVNQFLPIAAQRERGVARSGPDAARWFDTVVLAEQPWLRPDPDQDLTTVDTHPGRSTGDAASDAKACARIAATAGLDTIVVDQSRPDLALHVVKVVVPGLRHFWRRLGPGRLWSVPERLGRAPVAPDEDSINPLSIFF